MLLRRPWRPARAPPLLLLLWLLWLLLLLLLLLSPLLAGRAPTLAAVPLPSAERRHHRPPRRGEAIHQR